MVAQYAFRLGSTKPKYHNTFDYFTEILVPASGLQHMRNRYQAREVKGKIKSRIDLQTRCPDVWNYLEDLIQTINS